MLGSMGSKGGTTLFHIRYGGNGITLACLTISGVIGCYQPKCWLTSVGWITKLGCDQICGIGTPIILLVCSSWQVVKKFWFFLSLITSIHHPQRDNYWIHA
jgi:hypothetical protein